MTLLLASFILKSLLIAGGTLVLLHLLKNRSAAQRSAVAHAGLIALLLLPVGEMFLPTLPVEAPMMASAPPAAPARPKVEVMPAKVGSAPLTATISQAPEPQVAPLQWGLLLYGLPVLALLGITILALLRLFALRAKATVLVEPTWLSAMAHAQRRMGFKHGTALLTSSELSSPISWGVVRPVILLNEEALEATGEAEAIIAHELAHVSRLDWAKLLIARLATALHWFNPFAWLLSREAHQLREEAADDSVLAADIESTGYAQLLVGVARHECKGILLGAHGVAPGKDSLKRRVRRVLDADAVRGPGARSFALGVAAGALGFAAPLAALTLTAPKPSTATGPTLAAPAAEPSLPAAVASAVGEATRRSSRIASLAVRQGRIPSQGEIDRAIEDAQDERDRALENAQDARQRALEQAQEARERALEQAQGARERALEQAGEARERAAGAFDDRSVALEAERAGREAQREARRAMHVDPRYAETMRRALERQPSDGELFTMQAVGATPAWVADMSRAGYAGAPAGQLAAARAVGVDAAFARRMQRQYGQTVPLSRLIQLRAMSDGEGRVRMPRSPAAPYLPDWIRNGSPPPGLPQPPDDPRG